MKNIKKFPYFLRVVCFLRARIFRLRALRLRTVILTVILCAFAAALLINPQKYVLAAKEGLSLWALTVLPAVLPFFFITLTLSKLGGLNVISRMLAPITRFLYNADGAAGFLQISSFISGYPVGARLIAEFKELNALDSETATKLCTFCSTSGPLFIAGSVGAGMLNSPQAGKILLLSHILSAVFNGVLFRFYCDNRPIGGLLQKNASDNPLGDCAYAAASSCLTVGALICVFYVASEVLQSLNLTYPLQAPLAILLNDDKKAAAFTAGLIECTKGCKMLAETDGTLKLPLISAIIAFGGASVIAQSAAFLKSAGVKIKIFILSKLTQTVFAFVICLALCAVFNVY